jgi:hypothetical protein
VKVAALVPSVCLAASVRARGGGEGAVQVAWRSGNGGEGAVVRVLPVIGVLPAAVADLGDGFRRAVGSFLARGGVVGAAPLAALTAAVAAALPSLEAALTAVAAGGAKGSSAAVLRGGMVAAGTRAATGFGTAALSQFDRWAEAEAAEATEAAEAAAGKPEAPATAVVLFGRQTCVVCAEPSPTPGLAADGFGGGAAPASCGHWTCAEV